MPNDVNREDVLAWLERYDGNVPFLLSVQDWHRRERSLTHRQYVAVERNYVRMVLNAGTPDENLPEPATGQDAIRIRNGVYTLDNGTHHLTYQVYTATRGQLAGKRIVKRQAMYGRYEGFGFLTTEGELRLWQRFTADEDQTYVVWARVLLRLLNDNQITEQQAGTLSVSHEDNDWRVSYSTVCRVCNRRLTTPTSVAIGIGPECQRRQSEETTAADAHATVDTDTAALEMRRAAQEAQERFQAERERLAREERLTRMPMSQIDSSLVQ